MNTASWEQIKSILRGLGNTLRNNIENVKKIAEDASEKADNAKKTAANAASSVNGKMNASDPVGTGAFSMGRDSGSTIGQNSHCEGWLTVASNYCSHAEGCETEATGNCSHAEGYGTKANNTHAHAEGNGTIAAGSASHSEGQQTQANSDYTHAEGLHTIANGIYQHVQGRYNLPDKKYKLGVYAHIVGNGESNTARSNAHTLDWDGNAWFAGKVYVGGTSMDDATELISTPFVVTISGTGTTADHYSEEIWAAHCAGRMVYATKDGMILNLVSAVTNQCVFTATIFADDTTPIAFQYVIKTDTVEFAMANLSIKT